MYSVNQSFWNLVAQGIAETRLVGVFLFLAKSLADSEGVYIFHLWSLIYKRDFSAFPENF